MHAIEGLIIVAVCGLMIFLSGCSFRVEALYHGETPIGLENRQATELRADADRPKHVKGF